MMNTDWIIIDIETTGLAVPIYVVELAAQRMRGWDPVGEPFRKLVNQNQPIPPEASQVHGYTREVLERDGEPAYAVYAAFAEYVSGLPLVSYNLDHDLEQVLKPEWARLKVETIGRTGFCALRLAQRLLDPVPAGNCKLQTLRQYYHLPEHDAHSALGDVKTVVDLFSQVLRPVAKRRGLDAWEKLTAFANEEWYPTRLTFGKHKGKSIHDARKSPELLQWLEWLAASSNPKSAGMGRWYLRALERGPEGAGGSGFVSTEDDEADQEVESHPEGVVVYVDPGLERLRALIAASRARLAELEAAYTSEKTNVSALQARIFQRLRRHFEERDRLRLVVNYRRTFLDTLLREGEEEAERVREEYQKADARTKQEYEDTGAAMESKRPLSDDEESEVKSLWRNLVKLFHPDRFADDPEKMATYTKLTGAINTAKDSGDLETLRQIADDPAAYVMRHGWTAIDLGDTDEVEQLQKLFNSLEAEIIAVIEVTDALKESAEYELYHITEKKPEVFERIVEQQIAGITREVGGLKSEAERLEREINELSAGDEPDGANGEGDRELKTESRNIPIHEPIEHSTPTPKSGPSSSAPSEKAQPAKVKHAPQGETAEPRKTPPVADVPVKKLDPQLRPATVPPPLKAQAAAAAAAAKEPEQEPPAPMSPSAGRTTAAVVVSAILLLLFTVVMVSLGYENNGGALPNALFWIIAFAVFRWIRNGGGGERAWSQFCWAFPTVLAIIIFAALLWAYQRYDDKRITPADAARNAARDASFERLLKKKVYAPIFSAAAPTLQPPPRPVIKPPTYQPTTNEMLYDVAPGSNGPGVLTVRNGTDRNAIAKLINTTTDTKECSFLVCANSSWAMSGVRDGNFRLIFAYGDAVVVGSDHFESPTGFSEFKESFRFQTTWTAGGITYSTFSVTLHTVSYGNARTGKITPGEFDKY
jgi:DNA polymerase III epsilon subunit-like protein